MRAGVLTFSSSSLSLASSVTKENDITHRVTPLIVAVGSPGLQNVHHWELASNADSQACARPTEPTPALLKETQVIWMRVSMRESNRLMQGC